MALIDTFMRQRCVYWAPLGADEYGNQKYEDPIEMKCRWEDGTQVMGLEANQFVSNAQVFVPQPVQEKGVLFKGTLDDLTDYENPFNNDGAYEIRKYNEQPNLRAKKFLRYAWL
jgi:hypothetical protein